MGNCIRFRNYTKFIYKKLIYNHCKRNLTMSVPRIGEGCIYNNCNSKTESTIKQIIDEENAPFIKRFSEIREMLEKELEKCEVENTLLYTSRFIFKTPEIFQKPVSKETIAEMLNKIKINILKSSSPPTDYDSYLIENSVNHFAEWLTLQECIYCHQISASPYTGEYYIQFKIWKSKMYLCDKWNWKIDCIFEDLPAPSKTSGTACGVCPNCAIKSNFVNGMKCFFPQAAGTYAKWHQQKCNEFNIEMRPLLNRS